jgi:hypothetical protein
MRVTGTHQNFGIYGTSVGGITLDTLLFDGAFGTATASHESAAAFDELSGTALVRDSYFAGGILDNFRVHNAAGGTTLNRITFQTDTLGFTNTGAASGNALSVIVDAGTTNVTVANSAFLGAYQYNLEYLINNGGGDLAVQNNQFKNTQSNTNASFSHLHVRADASAHSTAGTLTYAVTGNTFTGSIQAPIYFAKGDGIWTLDGSMTGNNIGSAGTANSGSTSGEGIRIEHSGQGKHKVLISGNTITQYNNIAGISIRLLDLISGVTNDGSVHTTITNNTLSNIGTGSGLLDGVHFDVATSVGTSYTLCANFGHTGSNNLGSSYRASASGAPFSVGPITPSGNNGFIKLLGFGSSTFTGLSSASSAIDNLFSADNGFSTGLGFIDASAAAGSIQVGSSASSIGTVTCSLP